MAEMIGDFADRVELICVSIWIDRRNLPSVAKQNTVAPTPTTNELATPHTELTPPVSITESTTQKHGTHVLLEASRQEVLLAKLILYGTG